MERASDLRGRDNKHSKQKHQVVRGKSQGRGGPKAARISVEWGGKSWETKWRKRKESSEGIVGAALKNDRN